MKNTFAIVVAASALLAFPAQANSNLERFAPKPVTQAFAIPSALAIESAFSPEGGGQELVLRVLDSASRSVRLAAYSFTSPEVVRALMAAKRRGVDVQVVVDERANKSKSSTAALNILVNAGIPTRTISRYAIHHDKFIVADGRHVQNGSFNYSKAAASRNSENVMVVWNHPKLATSFTRHWESRWDQGQAYRSSY